MASEFSDKPPRVCVLTPAGRGAIAVLAVSGEGSLRAVDACFCAASGKLLAEIPVGQIAFGRWSHADGEEVVVTRCEESIEVHCHGGTAASRAVVKSLEARGCVLVDQSAWLAETANDAFVIAAQLALGEAQTEQAALVLLDQYHGALRRAVEQVMAHLDGGELGEAALELKSLYQRRQLGERLTSPARVVLTGPPNVGKSSLINALVGYERTIVFDTPGTTRDVVTATTAINGWAVRLIDTAGLRLAGTAVERAGIKLARKEIAQADLVLRVADANTWLAGETPATTFNVWTKDKQVVEVANKIDLLNSTQLATLRQQASASFVLTSATGGQGIEELLATIGAAVTPPEMEAGTAVPFTRNQVWDLQEVRALVAMGNAQSAKQALLSMLAASRD